MQKIFTDIYRRKVWYNGSGSGSLPENTVLYREFLRKYLQDNRIKSVLDLGCGDWQSSKLIDWTGIDYLGIDVVDFLIEKNNRQYSAPNIRFRCSDSFESLASRADLLIVKDVLQHWSNDRVQKFLADIKNLFPLALIINTGEGEEINSDINNGDFRPINILTEPFGAVGNELLRYISIRKISRAKETKVVIELKK